MSGHQGLRGRMRKGPQSDQRGLAVGQIPHPGWPEQAGKEVDGTSDLSWGLWGRRSQ